MTEIPNSDTQDLNRDGGEAPITAPEAAIFFLLLFIPIISTVFFGAVDRSAIGILAVLCSIIVVLWAWVSVRDRRFRLGSPWLLAPLAGLVLIGFVQLLPLAGSPPGAELLAIPASTALSIDPFATRMFLIRLIIYLVFFAAVLTFIRSERRVKVAVVTILAFGGLMAFYAILQRMAGAEAIYGIRETPYAIPFGSFVNQHHFAALMEMTSGVGLGLLFGAGVKRDKLPLLIPAVIVMSAAVFFTGSRGGALSFAGVFIFAAVAGTLLRHREAETLDDVSGSGDRRKLSAIAGAAAFIFLTLGLIVFLGADANLFRSIGLHEGTGDASSGRIHFWQVGLQIFAANPIIGTGLDTFGMAFTEFDTRSGMFRVENAHNDYLQTLTDTGLLGFACVIAFLVLLFRGALRSVSRLKEPFERAAAIGAMAGLFGIVIHSFFDFPLRTTSNGFFFLLLAALAVNIPARKRTRRRGRGN
jgi:O-antigen ligase